ncbi:MAG: anti-sigma regulatory factor [Kofleriaceae bacterium]
MPSPIEPVRVEVGANEDVVIVRQRAREHAQRAGFSLTETTKLVTAASELARNALEHGGGGIAEIELVTENGRTGVRMKFIDDGPGIASISEALRDGFTTGKGLGLGLGGSKRLVSDMTIDSAPGAGTRITVTKWK